MAIRCITRKFFHFLLGLGFGVAVSLIMLTLEQGMSRPAWITFIAPGADLRRLRQFSVDREKRMKNEAEDPSMGDGHVKEIKFEDFQEHHDDDTIARKASSRVRVLVWVMTGPQNLDKRAKHVRNTWGKRANKLLFMSSVWNHSFPAIGLDVAEGRDHLTAKSMKAFRYVYQHHFDDADWFMKADDDTYVIMENLRYLLSAYDPKTPVFFGKIFKIATKQGYTSGGAGYVLSKEALRRLATMGTNSSLCRQDGGAEDGEIGICLNNLGVKLLPSTDRLGRSRFHCFGVESHVGGAFPKWFYKYDVRGGSWGMDTISDYPITFHYVKPRAMYAMELFIYHIRPYGIMSRIQNLNRDDGSHTVPRR